MNHLIILLVVCGAMAPSCAAPSTELVLEQGAHQYSVRPPTTVTTTGVEVAAVVEPSREAVALASSLWRLSETAAEAGDAVAARRVLARLVRAAPNTAQSVAARVRLAEDALGRQDWSLAQTWVEPLEQSYERSRVFALSYEGQADYAKAAKAWMSASQEASDDATRRLAVHGAARDMYLDGELEDARQAAQTVGTGADELRALVGPRLEMGVLERLSEAVSVNDPDRAWIAIRHAQAKCAAGELTPCKLAGEIAAASTDSTIASEAQRLLERVAAWNEVRPTRLGILLPLSGRFQIHGQAALESIQQAMQGADHIELVIRDTAGQAGRAAQGAEELVLVEHVAAILGPIGEIESQAAVESAARFRVPHIVLTSNPDVCAGTRSALRTRLSAGEKVKALARYAVIQLGIKRAALLVPDQRARQRQMGAFWDEFVRMGGEIRAVESYPPSERDFKGVLTKLLGSSKPGKVAVDFDGLFIPDDALLVRRLVPFLKYYGVRTKTHPSLRTTKRSPPVQLLGVSAWNSSAVIDAEGLTDNAVFVDTFFHDPDDETVHRFVRAFYTRHRRKPNAFQAEVYDSFTLVAAAMKGLTGEDQTVRESLLSGLLDTKHHQGVTGHITVLDDGGLVLQPRFLTVHLDEIRVRLSEEEEAYMRRKPGRRQ